MPPQRAVELEHRNRTGEPVVRRVLALVIDEQGLVEPRQHLRVSLTEAIGPTKGSVGI